MNTTQLIQISPQTINLHQMISLVTEIEAEVYASPMYNNALATLTKNPKKEKNTAAILKKLTRSVIRVAFQRFMTPPQFSQQPFELSNHPVLNDFPDTSTEKFTTSPIQSNPEELQKKVDRDAEKHSQRPDESKVMPVKNSNSFVNKVKEFGIIIADSIELINSDIPNSFSTENQLQFHKEPPQKRESRLKEIGLKLREARLSKSMTIRQLNLKTAIICSHIEAIENGSIEKFPENIYLQGYIRRIGHAVGLDGDALATEFMRPNSRAVPEENMSEIEADENDENNDESSKYYLNSTQLLLGYVTLVAGAIGILSSTLNPTDSPIYIREIESDQNQPPTCKDKNNSSPTQKPELNSIDYGKTAQLSISPPELL